MGIHAKGKHIVVDEIAGQASEWLANVISGFDDDEHIDDLLIDIPGGLFVKDRLLDQDRLLKQLALQQTIPIDCWEQLANIN